MLISASNVLQKLQSVSVRQASELKARALTSYVVMDGKCA